MARSSPIEGFGQQMKIMRSTITCPKCRHRAVEQMRSDACQFFYVCKGCGERLKPLAGDCCVFCSYGSVRCPPKQPIPLSNSGL